MNQSINYFLQEIPGVASDNCKLYFDFLSGNNLQVINNKSGDPLLSGVIESAVNSPYFSYQIPNFWQNGSGYFSGDKYVRISNTTGINIQDFTACFIYTNYKKGGSTLISTIGTGFSQSYTEQGNIVNNYIYKGFDFGITANNYLYFEYYTDNGPEILLSKDNLSEKNSIFLSINNNNLSFGYYDFFKDSLVSYDYVINNYFLYNSNEIFIGYNPKATGTYAFNSSFTGFIEELLIFSPSIYNYEIINVNSGFAHIFDSGIYYQIIENLVTGITGYDTGIIGYENQLTGKELIVTNQVTGEFGDVYFEYDEQSLSGLVPYIGFTGLTGIISFDISSGYSGSKVIKNNSFIQNFGKSYINFIYENTSEDLIELNFTTNYQPKIYKNINFDYLLNSQSFTIRENLNLNKNYNIYANGQLQEIGDFYYTGNGYNSGKYIINDYIIDNDTLKFVNSYNEQDDIIADYIYEETIESSLYKFKQKLSGLKENTAEGRYGFSNAINNNETILLMGGLGVTTLASGGVLVYTGDFINGWTVKQKLTGDSTSDRFGSSTSINTGNVIVIGARTDGGSSSGSCFVFTGNSINGWNFRQKLTGDSVSGFNGFSSDINNDGTIILMGSNENDIPFLNCGGAFIYTGSPSLGWNFRQKLTGTFPQLNLGSSVAMNSSGNIIALGGYSSIYNSGSVFIYTGSSNGGWFLKQTISGLENQTLGSSIDINNNGEIILIGARGQLGGLNGSGLIYTGNSNAGWSLAQIISGDGPGNFGQSVSMSNNGNTIAVYGKIAPNQITLIYTGNLNLGWKFKQKIIDAISTPSIDYYRNSIISPSGNILMIGNIYNDSNTGSASIYNLDYNNLYTVNDNFIINSGNDFYILTGYTSDIYNVYFNGQKLMSGLHYQSNPLGYIQFNLNSYYYTGVTGKLTILKELLDFRITGSGNVFRIAKPYFLSEIYKNGVRQVLNNQYFELASIDSNTGKRLFDQKSDIIYNNITL